MIRPRETPKPEPLTLLDRVKVMATVGPTNVIAAFYGALASAGAEALETVAKKNGSEHVEKANEEREAAAKEAEEEDVIDSVVRLYDVY